MNRSSTMPIRLQYVLKTKKKLNCSEEATISGLNQLLEMPLRMRRYLLNSQKRDRQVDNENTGLEETTIQIDNENTGVEETTIQIDDGLPERYVFMNRMGGLGNQLFQYAAAKSIAYHHPNTHIYMDIERHNCHNHLGYDYAKIFMKDAMIRPDIKCCNEFNETFSFAPWHPKNFTIPIKLFGYFQYLPAIEPIIDDLVKEYEEGLRPFCTFSFDPHKTVFIHVRRGDYVEILGESNLLSKSYYEKAFEQWRQHYNGTDFHVFIVSDDHEWCRNQQWTFPYTLYENQDEIQTLALMSQCKAGAIIANSTFSYWGAMISQSPLVFYPKRWTGEDYCHRLCPSHWYGLDNHS